MDAVWVEDKKEEEWEEDVREMDDVLGRSEEVEREKREHEKEREESEEEESKKWESELGFEWVYVNEIQRETKKKTKKEKISPKTLSFS